MNTANRITLFRIALIPVFMFFLLTDYISIGKYIAVIIFVIAAVTDSVDGYVARKYNQITNFGKIADPLADKLLITSALICFVELGRISSWFVVIIIAREFMVTSLRVVSMAEGKVMAASFWGKLKTITQIAAVITLLMECSFPAINLWYVGDILIVIATALTLWSGVDYFKQNIKFMSFK